MEFIIFILNALTGLILSNILTYDESKLKQCENTLPIMNGTLNNSIIIYPETLIYFDLMGRQLENGNYSFHYNNVTIEINDDNTTFYYRSSNSNSTLYNKTYNNKLTEFEITNAYQNNFMMKFSDKNLAIVGYKYTSEGLEFTELEKSFEDIDYNFVLDSIIISATVEENKLTFDYDYQGESKSYEISPCSSSLLFKGASYTIKTFKYILCNEQSSGYHYVLYSISEGTKGEIITASTPFNIKYSITKGIVIDSDNIIIYTDDTYIISMKYISSLNSYEQFHLLPINLASYSSIYYTLNYSKSDSVYYFNITANTTDEYVHLPCMFVNTNSVDNTTVCALSCSSSDVYIGEVNYCNNCTRTSSNATYLFISEGNYTCVSQCEVGYIYDMNYKMCVKCEENTLVDRDNQQCVDHCDDEDGIVINRKERYCVNCGKSDKKYQYNENGDAVCIDSCGEGEVLRVDTCYDCQSNGLFFFNDDCIEQCPDRYVNSTNNICSKCPDKYNYFTRTCDVSNCSITNSNGDCLDCFMYGYVKDGDTCKETCDINTQSLSDGGICNTCNNTSFQYFCLSSCPNSGLVNIKNKKTCEIQPRTSRSLGTFLEYFDTICSRVNRYNLNGTCIDECPKYYYVNSNKEECKNCNTTTIYDKGKCENECTKFSFKYSDNNISYCLYCSDNSTYNDGTKCISQCAPYSELIEFYNYCLNCLSNGLFYYNSKCVSSCPPNSIVDENNQCIVCAETFTFYYNNQCLSECPSNLFTDYINNACLETNTSQCSQYGTYNETTEQCDCETNYYGEMCQYDIATIAQQVNEYETKMILKQTDIELDDIIQSEDSTSSILINDEYIKAMRNYLGICKETTKAFSIIIFDDLIRRLSFAIKYVKSSMRNVSQYDFYLFDFYFTMLSLQYKMIEENNIDNIPYDDSIYPYDEDDTESTDETLYYNRYAIEYDLIGDTMSTFTVGKQLLTSFIDIIIDKDNLLSLYVNYTDNFKINIAPFNNYISYKNKSEAIDNNYTSDMINLLPSPYIEDSTSFVNYYNISQCESSLRSQYKIDNDDNITSYTITFNSTMNIDYNKENILTNSLYVKLHHNNFEYDTSLCESEHIYYKMRLNANKKTESILFYSQTVYATEKINVMSSKEKFFTSRCYKYKTNNTYPLYTLQQRIDMYFLDKVIECIPYKNYSNVQCESSAIDDDRYITCDCNGMEDMEIALMTVEKPKISKYTIDIVGCIFDKGNFSSLFNIGFYISVILPGVFIVMFIAAKVNLSKFYSHNMESVIYNDCFTLNYAKTKKSFINFNRGKFKRNNNIEYFQNQYETIIEEKVNIMSLNSNEIHNEDVKNNIAIKCDSIEYQRRRERNRKIREKYFISSENKKSTLNDIESVDILIRFNYHIDKRNAWNYLIDYINGYSIISITFFRKSIIVPKSIRLTLLYIDISMILFLSMLFYHEEIISTQLSLSSSILTFVITNKDSLAGIILTVILSSLIMLILKLFIKLKQKTYNELNIALITLDENVIDHTIEMLYDSMFFKYIVLYIVAILISIINVAYFSSFSKIYTKCINGWLSSVLYVCLIDYLFIEVIAVPLIALFIWLISDKIGVIGRIMLFMIESLKMSNRPGVYQIDYDGEEKEKIKEPEVVEIKSAHDISNITNDKTVDKINISNITNEKTVNNIDETKIKLD